MVYKCAQNQYKELFKGESGWFRFNDLKNEALVNSSQFSSYNVCMLNHLSVVNGVHQIGKSIRQFIIFTCFQK